MYANSVFIHCSRTLVWHEAERCDQGAEPVGRHRQVRVSQTRPAQAVPQRGQGTFDDSLDRLVRSGILVRAARGVYVYRLTRHFSDATPDLIARNLRRGYLVYESLESALSMYGAISQIPVDRRTYMTTGRRGEYRTPYRVIEFTHTARTIDRIAPGLLHTEGRGVPVASKQLALRDLKATGRNSHLGE